MQLATCNFTMRGMQQVKSVPRNKRSLFSAFRLDNGNTRKCGKSSRFGEIKEVYFRRFDLTSVITRNGKLQVGLAKKNAAAPNKYFASRFAKIYSRTDAKSGISSTPDFGGF